MEERYVLISFAKPLIYTPEVENDIRMAVKSASHNLWIQHKIDVSILKIWATSIGYTVFILKLDIPNEIQHTFSIGRHLRGISNYLLRYCKKTYLPYKVGNRLLQYLEINEATYSIFSNNHTV